MKKKIQKPLKLSRETLTSLNHGDLREPVGAVSQIPNACTSVCSGAACATASTCGVVNTQCVGW